MPKGKVLRTNSPISLMSIINLNNYSSKLVLSGLKILDDFSGRHF